MAYEVVKIIDKTKIELIPRKFGWKFQANRTAKQLNEAEAGQVGLYQLFQGRGPRWTVLDSRTVTLILEKALENAKRAEAQEAPEERSTGEIVLAMDEALAETPPKLAARPRTRRTVAATDENKQ